MSFLSRSSKNGSLRNILAIETKEQKNPGPLQLYDFTESQHIPKHFTNASFRLNKKICPRHSLEAA